MSNRPSIRDQLEHDAWRRYPHFARRRAGNPVRQDRTPLRWQDRALLILAITLVLLLIIRVETVRAAPSGEPFWGIEAVGPGGFREVALNTDFRVDVTGLVARVEVTQRFRNDGAAWKEAVYRFPLPAGAAVDRLRIEARGRVIEGEIQERSLARRTYQQALDTGQTASLVEQHRPNQFETRLANIGPGEEISIELGFLATVDFRDGSFSLQLPLTFTPRWESAASDPLVGAPPGPALIAPGDRDEHYLTADILLHGAADLLSIESRYHDVDILPETGGYRVRLTDPDARSDREFALSWTPAYGTAPAATVSTWDGGDAVYAQLMLAPPLTEALAPTSREVVFVIDTSGSMEGTSISQARAALRQGLDYLGAEDRFNVVRFDSDSEQLYAASVAVDAGSLARARGFIDALTAGGGTDMKPALEMAMALPRQHGLMRQIVFITDGSVGNEEQLLLEIAEKLGDSRLFTVAIGSAPNTWFMRKAAMVGRGSYSHIGKQAEVAERMALLWARIENPALQNLAVDWGMEAEYYPEILPDLYAGEPLWLYARLPFEPREVTLSGEFEGHYWETVSRLDPLPGGEALASLWARSRIEALEDSRIFGVDRDAIRSQVLELALEFGLLTPYTSMVAVDRTPVRPALAGLESEEVPGLLPAGTATAAGFLQTGSGWGIRLALALLSLSIATGMLLYLPPSRAQPVGGARRPGVPVPP